MKLMANLRIPLINRVQAAGRLTRDPEMLHSQQGTSYTKTGFAYAAPKDAKATFVDIIAFGKTSERLIEMRKGAPIIVEGRLQIDRYEKEGQEKKYVTIVADYIHALEWADDDAIAATPPPARNDAQRVSTPPPHPASTSEDDIPF
jgi:single-strand DNA-binding protein